jgi:hypothetical protein
MPKTISDAARNAILDRFVQNLDGIELKDTNGTVIATTTGESFNSASGGTVDVSGTPTLTGNANASTGTDATNARLYDDSTATGEEVDGLIVAQDQNFSAWSTSTSYQVGDKVTNTVSGDTFRFEVTTGHTSDSEKEPGVGDTWPKYFDLVDLVIDNTNIADGQTVDINSLLIVQPSVFQ